MAKSVKPKVSIKVESTEPEKVTGTVKKTEVQETTKHKSIVVKGGMHPDLKPGHYLISPVDANGNEYGTPFLVTEKTFQKAFNNGKFIIKKK